MVPSVQTRAFREPWGLVVNEALGIEGRGEVALKTIEIIPGQDVGKDVDHPHLLCPPATSPTRMTRGRCEGVASDIERVTFSGIAISNVCFGAAEAQ